jgi:ubiquinone/menaquinone biosynthesis C-methylase UbiE
MSKLNPIVSTYSELADQYDEDGNAESCWGRVTRSRAAAIRLEPAYHCIADVGCGTGWALVDLAARSSPDLELIGVDPAPNMCRRARKLAEGYPNIRILEGSFEDLPLESASVDYLYSTLAFHWCADPERAVEEIARVLHPAGSMDLVFIGRENGCEFIKATSPIFLRHMGPELLLRSARLRRQLTRSEADALFRKALPARSLSVEETFETYHDSLEGHWSWWVRIEGHFVAIPHERKEACDAEVKAALGALEKDGLIPYTVHLLHVRIRG